MVRLSSVLEFLQSVTSQTEHRLGYHLFRVGYGVTLILFVIGYVRMRTAFSGATAILDRESFLAHANRPWGLFDLFSDRTAFWLAALMGTVAGGLLCGSRVPAGFVFPLIWISLCSFHGRNPHFNSGADDVFRLLAVAFLPDFSGMAVPRGVFAAQVLILAVYWNTAIYKWMESEWQTGEALYGFSRLTAIRRFDWQPRLTSVKLYRPLTYLSLCAETGLPVLLLFEETVVVGVSIGLGIHVALQVFCRIHLFQVVMVLGLCLFPTDSHYRFCWALLKN